MGPCEFVRYNEEELSIEGIKAACKKHFSSSLERKGLSCDILAGEQGPSCHSMKHIPDFKVIHVRFIKSSSSPTWQLEDEYESSSDRQNASQFDRRLFRSKVVSIDESRFDRRQESVQSVSTELTIYQICLKIFSLAVDKRTKNNQALSVSFYHHLLFYQNLCFDRTDVWFRSNELSIETTFDRTDSIPIDSIALVNL